MIPYKGRVTLEKTIKYLREEVHYLIDPNDANVSDLKFRLDEEEISKILFQFYKKDISLSNLSYINHFCDILNLSINSNHNKAELMELMNLYIKNNDKFLSYENLDKLFSCFGDKKMGVEYLRYIYTNKKINFVIVINCFVNYLIQARPYYVDDRALLTSAINLVDSIDESILLLGSSKDVSDVINKKLIEDKKANGIYDIDQFTLEELDRKFSEFELLINRLEGFSQMADQQIDLIKNETKNSSSEVTNLRIKTLKELKTETNKILTDFRKHYLDLLSQEKENIINQRDILMAELDTEIQKRKLELEALAVNVGQRIKIELGRIKNVSDHSMEQIQNYVSNNEGIKKMLDVAKSDEAFLARLSKIDDIPVSELSSMASIVQPSAIAVPGIIVPKPEREVDPKINYYFDKQIPFKDRFDELMDKKQEDIEKNGAIYHEKFDDLLTLILNNNTPYMHGPSGCGKTYMIEHQLAKLLGLDVVTNGYVMYESDILGFNNANGAYVPSNFYRCYKFGDIIFFDELDNSHASSTIVLNSFIGKGVNSAYTFPDGERIEMHPNFRILAAGNTSGNGRTDSHNTRVKLDESVMQRLTPIEIGYDNRIEKKILENYPEWYNFAVNFRESLKNIRIGGEKGPNYHGTITTRDIQSIKNYKDDNSFSDEKIIEYEVIENKDPDYLNQIISAMDSLSSQGKFTEGGQELLEKFKVLSRGRKY